MRVLFTTDLHGCVWKYDRILEAAQNSEAELIINGGDMLPTTGDLFAQDRFVHDYLDNHFGEFNAAKIHYACCLGNDDLRIFDDVFEETCNKYPYVVNLAQRKSEIGDYEFIGMNWVADYPFRLKDRCRMDTKNHICQEQFGTALLSTLNGWKEIEDWFAYAKTLPTIEDELERLVRPARMAQSVYVLHMPPYRLGLDDCGHGLEVGSKSIYAFLQTHQPRLSLHGHIHESPEFSGKWYAQLGSTKCIQPGQMDPFTYVTIDLQTMQCERHVVEGKRPC